MCGLQKIIAKNGDVVSGRSMEFDSATGSNMGEVTVGEIIDSETGEKTSLSFTGWYTDIGYTVAGKHFGVRTFCEGINSKGYRCSTLWLSRVTKYDTSLVNPKDGISGLTLPQKILGTCTSHDDVRKLLAGKRVHIPAKFLEKYATIRCVLTDKKGEVLVVEFKEVNGKAGTPVFYESNGTVTNYPSYEWYQTFEEIECNYRMLDNGAYSDDTHEAGCGSNLRGMSASRLPQDRFRIMNVNTRLATEYEQPKNGDEAFTLLANIFGLVHIQKGTTGKKSALKTEHDHTQWIVLVNHTTGEIEIKRPHESRNWEKVKAKPIKLECTQDEILALVAS